MPVGRKILVVDDDAALRHSLAEQLRLHEEFVPLEAEDGTKALELAGQQYFDAVLLDVGLPDMDGRELCRLLRRAGVRAPILMLTPFSASTPAPTTTSPSRSASASCSPGCAPSCANTSRARTPSSPSA